MSIISQAMDKARGREEGPKEPAPEISRIRPGRDTRQETGSPMTRVQLPDEGALQKNRIMSSIEDQSVLDAYNLLRTQILQQTKANGWNTIMITSVGPREGKTTTAINLGMSMARDAQQTALLVDTHLRSPRVHEYLDLDVELGLTDYLLENTPVSELLVNPGVDQFVVLPAGRPLKASTDILKSPKMHSLVKELKHRYRDRYVLFDCPHILNMPDSLVFSSYVDGVILLVDADRTSGSDITSALSLLGDCNLIGLVMNKVR